MRFLPVVLISVLAAGAACGASYADSHSAQQIVQDAGNAFKSVKSFHLIASSGGTNLDMDFASGNLKGTLSGTVNLKVAVVSSKTYVHGTELLALMEGQPLTSMLAAELKSRITPATWVLLPASLSGGLGMDTFDPQRIGGCLASATKVSKGPKSTVNGQSTIEIDDTVTAGMKINVMLDSPHYPVKLVAPAVQASSADPLLTCPSGGKSAGTSGATTLSLSRFNAVQPISAPSPVVDLSTAV